MRVRVSSDSVPPPLLLKGVSSIKGGVGCSEVYTAPVRFRNVANAPQPGALATELERAKESQTAGDRQR